MKKYFAWKEKSTSSGDGGGAVGVVGGSPPRIMY